MGRGVAAYLFSSCDSEKVIAYLGKEKNWPGIERELALQFFEEVDAACKKNRSLDENNLSTRTYITGWSNLVNRVAVKEYDLLQRTLE